MTDYKEIKFKNGTRIIFSEKDLDDVLRSLLNDGYIITNSTNQMKKTKKVNKLKKSVKAKKVVKAKKK